MRTEPRVSEERPARGGPAAAHDPDLGWVAAIGIAVLVALIVVPFFLATYQVHTFQTPLGWDTSKYLWKTSLAAHLGATNLPSRLPPPVNGSPDRPGFPVVALVFHALTGASTLRIAAALPAILAAAIGLAAGAFVSVGLRRPWWQSALVAVSVGTSIAVVRMAAPEAYQDNLLAAAALLAALVPVALALRRPGRGGLIVSAAVLLGAAVMVHWAIAAMFVGLLALTAMAFLPESLRERRAGRPAVRTPAGTLGAICGGAAVVGAVGMFGLLGAVPKRPKISPQARTEYLKKLRLDLPFYRLWFALPVAAVGAWVVGRRGRERPPAAERFAGTFMGVWLGVTAVGALLSWAGAPVPGHRLLAFALPIPILFALGAIAVGRFAALRWSRLAGAAVVVLVLGVSAYWAQAFWLSARPVLSPDTEKEVANAAAYLQAAHVPASKPVVFIVNDSNDLGVNVAKFAHSIRASLPAERIRHAFVYLGDPRQFLARRPTILRPNGTPAHRDYDGPSWRYFWDVRPLYEQHPVALLMPSVNPNRRFFDRWTAAHPGSLASPGVFVVSGPGLGNPLPAAPSPVGPISAFGLAWIALAIGAVLFVVGLGWTLAITSGHVPRLAAAGMAPGVGIAAVVAAGVLVDRLGFRLTPGVAWVVPVAAGALGWMVWLRTRARTATEPEASPAAP